MQPVRPNHAQTRSPTASSSAAHRAPATAESTKAAVRSMRPICNGCRRQLTATSNTRYQCGGKCFSVGWVAVADYLGLHVVRPTTPTALKKHSDSLTRLNTQCGGRPSQTTQMSGTDTTQQQNGNELTTQPSISTPLDNEPSTRTTSSSTGLRTQASKSQPTQLSRSLVTTLPTTAVRTRTTDAFAATNQGSPNDDDDQAIEHMDWADLTDENEEVYVPETVEPRGRQLVRELLPPSTKRSRDVLSMSRSNERPLQRSRRESELMEALQEERRTTDELAATVDELQKSNNALRLQVEQMRKEFHLLLSLQQSQVATPVRESEIVPIRPVQPTPTPTLVNPLPHVAAQRPTTYAEAARIVPTFNVQTLRALKAKPRIREDPSMTTSFVYVAGIRRMRTGILRNHLRAAGFDLRCILNISFVTRDVVELLVSDNYKDTVVESLGTQFRVMNGYCVYKPMDPRATEAIKARFGEVFEERVRRVIETSTRQVVKQAYNMLLDEYVRSIGGRVATPTTNMDNDEPMLTAAEYSQSEGEMTPEQTMQIGATQMSTPPNQDGANAEQPPVPAATTIENTPTHPLC